MKTLALIILYSLACNFCFGQNRQSIDNLKHQLALVKQDTSRVILLCEIGYQYRNFHADSGMFYLQQGLSLARKINFLRGEVRALERIAANERVRGNLIQSLDMSYKSLEIAEKNGFFYEKARVLNSIGLINRQMNENHKALGHHQKSLQLFDALQDEENVALLLSNISQDYLQLNRLDSALYYGIKAHKATWYEKVRHDFQYIIHLLNLGDIYKKMGNNQFALVYYQQGLREGDKDDHRTRAESYNRLATYYKEINKPDSCIYYAKKGFFEAQQASTKRTILISSSLLSEMYESKDSKEALRYYKIANAAKDSLYGIEKIQGLQKIFLDQYERQQKSEIERTTYQNQLKQYAFLGGLAILSLIAFILYRNNQKEKKSKILLQKQKEKIETTLSILQSTQAQLIQKEKLASLGELTAGIAHEIQNPLNFVNNFSELSVDLADELEDEIKKPELDRDLIADLTKDLKSNQEKINHHGKRASSIVKGMLEHSRASTGVKELTDINKLADEYLRLAYHGLHAKDNTFNSDYKTEFDENLPLTNVIPQDIGRVLLNLINNAFWAVKTVEKPLVVVKTVQAENQIIIKVSDNGTGMSELTKAKIFQPFFTTKPTGEGTGLGLSLAYDIVTKGHAGTLEVESTEGVGSEFIISLPFKTNGL